jgi:hypothetical protein
MAIGEQSRKINRILRDVNAAVINRSSEAVNAGEKLITEYGYYRYRLGNPASVVVVTMQ